MITPPTTGRVRSPVRVAGLEGSTAVLVTVIDSEWLVTTFPDESWIVMVG